MVEKILFIFGCMSLLSACDSKNPEINTACVRDEIGNYILKWETDPEMDGTMKMYISSDPDSFPETTPVGYAKINDGITTYITNENINRKYFKLVFNDKYSQIVGSRAIPMDSIQNMRDLGGYKTHHNIRSVKWGKIFRSGTLASVGNNDKLRLNNLRIKTILDLHTEGEAELDPADFPDSKIISVAIPIKNGEMIKERILKEEVCKGDGTLFMQDLYLSFVDEYKDLFGEALKVLLQKDNYPIVMNCALGKDRVGYLTALVLTILNVPEETIRKDYTDSNEYINLAPIAAEVHNLNDDTQETLTVLLHANEALLDLSFKQIRKEYGSIDKYLSNGLGFTAKDRETLRDILLE